MIAITIDGNTGLAEGMPIGVAVALSEDGGFQDVAQALWTLGLPPGSQAELDTVGTQVAPFDNGFTPDVPGDYTIELTVTFEDGSTEQTTQVLACDLPYITDAGIPGPGETTERGEAGWADGAGGLLNYAAKTRRGADLVTFYNGSGGTLTAGTIVSLTTQRRWPDLTGGTPVAGSPCDWIAGTVGSTTPVMLGLVLSSVNNGQRGVALRRGMVPFDTSGWTGITAGAPRAIYYGGPNAAPTAKPNPFCIGQALVLSSTADPAGWVFFNPEPLEAQFARGAGFLTLADNAGATDLSSALQWAAADIIGLSIRFGILRGEAVKVGRITVAVDDNAPEAVATVTATDTTAATGVTLSVALAAGTVKLQYATTSTGQTASMYYLVEEVWNR